MDDPPHVGFVNAHPESNGGAHDLDIIFKESLLHRRPLLSGEPGMVVLGLVAFGLQLAGYCFGGVAAKAINDAGLVRVPLQEIVDLGQAVPPGAHPQPDVRPVKRGDKYFRLPQLQLLLNVSLGQAVGSGGESDDRNLGELLLEAAQLGVLRPEIVTPGGNTVRLVYGKQIYVQPPQKGSEISRKKLFGGNVKELYLPLQASLLYLVLGLGRLGTI